ncbi:MAG: EAL domain-containing protein [Snowella sp.]|nr:EAL domain-containing protein [Snowella sp.]
MLPSQTPLTATQLQLPIIRDPLIVTVGAKVIEAIALMSAYNQSCALSCDIDGERRLQLTKAKTTCVLVVDQGQLVGIVTERDLVRISSRKYNLAETNIAEVMVSPVHTLKESDFIDIFAAINCFQTYQIRHLPLVSDRGEVVGLLTHESLRQILQPVDLLRLRTVAEVMTAQVICSPPTASILELTELMSQNRVSSVVIAHQKEDGAFYPIGIITERDIVQFLNLDLDFSRIDAQTVMSSPVFSVNPEISLWATHNVMQERQINRLVVADEQGRLQGIVTQTTLLNALDPLEIYQLVNTLEQKLSQLKTENLQLLQNRNSQLEQLVEERTLELRESHEIFRQFADNHQGVVIIFDREKVENRVLYVSPAYEKIFGQSCEDFYNNPAVWLNAVHPDDRDRVIQAYLIGKKQGIFNEEYRIIRPDGEIRWIWGRCFPIRNMAGEIYRTGNITEDITERKQAERELEQQENFLRTVIDTSQNRIFVNDQAGNYLLANQASAQYYQLPVEDLLSKTLTDLELPETLDTIQQINETVIRCDREQIIPAEKTINPSGEENWWQWQKYPITVPRENIRAVLSVGINITEQKQTEERLKESEQRLRESESLLSAMFEGSAVGIVVVDTNGYFIRANTAYQKMVGYSSQELKTKNFLELTPLDYQTKNWNLFQSVIQGKQASFQIEKPYYRRDGSSLWVRVTASKIASEPNKPTLLVEVIEDISAQKQAQELIHHNALHDPLTNLPNRTLLMERIELALKRAKRVKNYNFALLFLDLDRFKIINDSLGHLVGDQLLIHVANKLKSYLRETDLVARLGGDEFVILLEDIANTKQASQVAERILNDCQLPFMVGDYEMSINTSIGLVVASQDYEKASDLLRDADIAMYKAKIPGGNNYRIFDNQMHIQALSRLNLETSLRKALDRDEFVVYYQPIMDIVSDRLVGFEALIRWQHPERGLLSPNHFMPIAEETGLVIGIDCWVIESACQQIAQWKDHFSCRFPLKVSLNLSAHHLQKTSLIQDIDTILNCTGLTGEAITLEITESMLIENINKSIQILEQLKARNIQISIDDFGTGYSSLNYLHRLPADNLKIDRSFVSQMQEGNRNYQVVSTIIALSNQLGLAVVGEGIETYQQLQWLKQLGCEFGQGYLFSKPLTATEIETYFLSPNCQVLIPSTLSI